MRGKNSLLRLQRFRFEEARRQVLGIERMGADFQKKRLELDSQIETEENRTGVHDQNHFEYSTTARSLRARRDNLDASAQELKEQLNEAQKRLVDEEAELKRIELLFARDLPSPSYPPPKRSSLDLRSKGA